MKKKIILMSAAAVLLVASVAGGTLAGFVAQTNQPAQSKVETRELDIEIRNQAKKEVQSTEISLNGAVPGEEVKAGEHQLCAGNEGTIDMYVRVFLNKGWARNGERLYDLDAGYITLLPEGDNWFTPEFVAAELAKDKEEVVLYYKVPVKAGESTDNFLDSFKISTAAGNEYTKLQIVVQAEAEAVQASGNDEADEKAILAAWGLNATIENGTIIKITE